ncbi:MAG: hypothetical protein ABDH37_01160 [Candidatus Hydrothermales bacterium]
MNFISVSLLAGSLWGIGEVLIWELLKILNVNMKSPFVFAYGILILTLSRKIYDKKGISIITGLIALSFKFLHSKIFFCQFVAVMIEALFFEIGFSLIPYLRGILIPLFSTYFSFLGFALTAVYILKVSGWVKRGISGITHYVFVNGSIAFLLSLITFNLAIILYNYFLSKEIKKVNLFYKKFGLIFSILIFLISWMIINF